MNRKIKRPLIYSVLILIFALVFYSFKIEPYRLKALHYELSFNETSTERLKVVQFSDVHIKKDYTATQLAKVVDLMNQQEADFVVFTGDLYDNYSVYADDEMIIKELSRVSAKIDKIAIWGNRDYGGSAENHYANIMNQAGFKVLKNEISEYTHHDKRILFTGLDDELLGNIEIPKTQGTYDAKFLLAHEPDIVNEYKDLSYHLVLSGHSHGGQIKVPGLSIINKFALSYTVLASHYGMGLYPLENHASDYLYVNTGLGTTHISARFNVVPSISVFEILI